MSVRWRECTALFGGTFDPPHLGHREAVRGLFERPGVGRVIVLPAAAPPQKPCVAQASDRLELVRRNFAPDPAHPWKGSVEISEHEFKAAAGRSGRLSYSFDTVSELKRETPELAFVVGTDQLAKLGSWHRFPELLGLCHWIVLRRQGVDSNAAETVLASWLASGLLRPGCMTAQPSGVEREYSIHPHSSAAAAGEPRTLAMVPTSAPMLSSSEIRLQITRTGHPAEGDLRPEVVEYLKLHRIYGTERS